MARKKATAEATAAPKKRASRKKSEEVVAEVESEVTETEAAVDEADEVDEVGAVDEVLAEVSPEPQPEPEPRKTKAKGGSRKKEKAAPVVKASPIDSLIPPVRLALVEAAAELPAPEVISEAFTAFYTAALERMRYALVTAAEAPPPPPPAPLDAAPPPLDFELPSEAEIAEVPAWDLSVEDAFDAPPDLDGASELTSDGEDLFEALAADAEPAEAPEAVVAEENEGGVLFDETLVAVEDAEGASDVEEASPPAEPAEPDDEATVNFDPSLLVAMIDGDAPVEAVSEVAESAAEAPSDDGEASAAEASADAAPAEGESAASAPRKSRKSKRKR